MTNGTLPVGTCQKHKGKEQAEEDGDEYDVGAQCADQVQQAEQAHEEQEKSWLQSFCQQLPDHDGFVLLDEP